MSPPKTGGHSFSETEQGRRNSIRTSPKRSKTFGIWSIFYWALFSGFSLSYFLFLLLLYFYQLHRFVKRGFLPSLQHVSLPFHVFIPGHTFKLMSQFYVSISQTRNELLLHGVKSQKTLMPAKKKKKKRGARGLTGLSWATKPPAAPRLGSGGTSEAALLPRGIWKHLSYIKPHKWWIFAKRSTQHSHNSAWRFYLCARKVFLVYPLSQMFRGWCLIVMVIRSHLLRAGERAAHVRTFSMPGEQAPGWGSSVPGVGGGGRPQGSLGPVWPVQCWQPSPALKN